MNHNTYWDIYFLIGIKNGFAINLSIMTTDKWTKEYKLNFLKKMYLHKKTE
jgi:hypothetical protein